MSQKLLGWLVVMQFVLVALLFWRQESYEDRIDAPAQSNVEPSTAEPASTSAILSAHDGSNNGQSDFDDQQIRRIIREELELAFSHFDASSQNTTSTQEAPVYDALEMRYQRELVIQELESLKQQTEVSGGELERLMGDIAKLDPETRTEMMKMLNQALNRGEIKGNL